MADRMDSPVVEHTNTRYAQHTQTNFGSDGDERDNDDASQFGVESSKGGDGSTECYVQSDHEWGSPVKISSFRALGQMQYTAGNYFNGDMDVEISLKIDGVWTKVVDAHWDNSPSGSNTWGTRNFEYNENNGGDGWEGVTGIRVYVYCYAYSYEGNRAQVTRARLYELSAEYVAGGFAQLI